MRFVRLLLRLTLFIGAAFIGLLMMVFALVAIAGVLCLALLSGRKPVVNFSAVRRAKRRMSSGEVVDVEAREVPPEKQHLVR